MRKHSSPPSPATFNHVLGSNSGDKTSAIASSESHCETLRQRGRIKSRDDRHDEIAVSRVLSDEIAVRDLVCVLKSGLLLFHQGAHTLLGGEVLQGRGRWWGRRRGRGLGMGAGSLRGRRGRYLENHFRDEISKYQ